MIFEMASIVLLRFEHPDITPISIKIGYQGFHSTMDTIKLTIEDFINSRTVPGKHRLSFHYSFWTNWLQLTSVSTIFLCVASN